MAKEFPPYVSATGLLLQLFKKIREATPPQRFSQDFLFDSLKFKKSGSTAPFIPFLKRIGFLGSDGIPTDIYKKFRNPDEKISGVAMAQAMKIGYAELFASSEYWYKKEQKDLKNFLVEVLEAGPKDGKINFLISTINTLKGVANFEETIAENKPHEDEEIPPGSREENGSNNAINLSYTINLNLPETSDSAVFEAIFKSLKQHLLK